MFTFSWLWSNRAWKVSLGGVPRLRCLRYLQSPYTARCISTLRNEVWSSSTGTVFPLFRGSFVVVWTLRTDVCCRWWWRCCKGKGGLSYIIVPGTCHLYLERQCITSKRVKHPRVFQSSLELSRCVYAKRHPARSKNGAKHQ